MGSHQEWLASIGRRTTRERQATSNMESATMATLAVMVPIGIGATHGIAAMVLPMSVAIVISGSSYLRWVWATRRVRLVG